MVVDLEKIIELEREDRLRPRLKDRELSDWMYFLRHPLHQHDVEMFTYYFNIGLGLLTVRLCVRYAVWVKDEFFKAKAREDAEIGRRFQIYMKQQQSEATTVNNQTRSFSTWRTQSAIHDWRAKTAVARAMKVTPNVYGIIFARMTKRRFHL